MFAHLASIFAGLALLLVSVGLYGTLAYTMARRCNEIGLRLAFLRRGLSRVGSYGVEPTDAVTIGGALLIPAAVGSLAG